MKHENLPHCWIICYFVSVKVYLATDHGGFDYKEKIKKWLAEQDYEIEDCGAHKLDPDDDYTDYVIPLSEKVAQDWEDGKQTFGIILGRSGNGELIAANKVKGVRAIMGCNSKMAEIARQHNNANIISFGADHLEIESIKEAITKFLNTNFLNKQRYIRRIKAHESYVDLHYQK